MDGEGNGMGQNIWLIGLVWPGLGLGRRCGSHALLVAHLDTIQNKTWNTLKQLHSRLAARQTDRHMV